MVTLQEAEMLKTELEGLNPSKVELIGTWLWVRFNGSIEPEKSQVMKSLGFRYNVNRQVWQLGEKIGKNSSNIFIDEIRSKYGGKVLGLGERSEIKQEVV